jgi:putative ABC transport system substrate-binding protein
VGFLWNPDHPDNDLPEAERAGQSLGVQLKPLAVRGPADFDGAFVAATQARVDALYVVSSRLTLQNLGRIVNFAAENRLPLAGGFGAWAKQHGLLSYGPNLDDMTRPSRRRGGRMAGRGACAAAGKTGRRIPE